MPNTLPIEPTPEVGSEVGTISMRWVEDALNVLAGIAPGTALDGIATGPVLGSSPIRIYHQRPQGNELEYYICQGPNCGRDSRLSPIFEVNGGSTCEDHIGYLSVVRSSEYVPPLTAAPLDTESIISYWRSLNIGRSESRPHTHIGRKYYRERQEAIYQKGEKHGREFAPMISTTPSYVKGYNRGTVAVMEEAEEAEYHRGWEDGKARRPNASNATQCYLIGHRGGWREREYELDEQRSRERRRA